MTASPERTLFDLLEAEPTSPAEREPLPWLPDRYQREQMRKRDRERLIAIAQEIAAKAHPHPVTVENLRTAAVNRHVLTGEEKGRTLSYLGGVMQAAGLVRNGRFRRSELPRAHGNLQAEWQLATAVDEGRKE